NAPTDEFWTFGARDQWSTADEPTYAIITITGSNGQESATINGLTDGEDGTTFQSLLVDSESADEGGEALAEKVDLTKKNTSEPTDVKNASAERGNVLADTGGQSL